MTDQTGDGGLTDAGITPNNEIRDRIIKACFAVGCVNALIGAGFFAAVLHRSEFIHSSGFFLFVILHDLADAFCDGFPAACVHQLFHRVGGVVCLEPAVDGFDNVLCEFDSIVRLTLHVPHDVFIDRTEITGAVFLAVGFTAEKHQ